MAAGQGEPARERFDRAADHHERNAEPADLHGDYRLECDAVDKHFGLGIHLRGQSVGDPLEVANSPEVIEFNRGSISRWNDAVESSATATTEEIAAAREAAVAQYTTPPS